MVEALAAWQPVDGCGGALHPGDVGWFLRFEDEVVERSLWAWRDPDDRVVAVGLFDDPSVLRTAVAPPLLSDPVLARSMSEHADARLAEGAAYLDAPAEALLRSLLVADGWALDEDAWVLLYRGLGGQDAAVVAPGVAPVAGNARERVDVQRAAFAGSTFTLDRWRLMAAGPGYDGRLDLVARDEDGVAVAGGTAWSAGPGRCGLLEPVGARRDRSRQGHGRRVVSAACAALARLGACGVAVWTPKSNVAALGLYRSAGLRPLSWSTTLTRA